MSVTDATVRVWMGKKKERLSQNEVVEAPSDVKLIRKDRLSNNENRKEPYWVEEDIPVRRADTLLRKESVINQIVDH